MELSLVGPSNRLAARTADPSRSVNWFPETIITEGQKTRTYFRYTLGIEPHAVFGDGPNTALFEQDGRSFAINGTVFAEFLDGGSVIQYGTVVYDADFRAQIVSNGTAGGQLLIASGGSLYTFDLTTDTFAAVTDPDAPADVISIEFFLGYFLAFIKDTRRFQWSALEDGSSWDILDTAERSWGSDNIKGLIRTNTQFWLFGSKTTEVWYATGGVDVFAPIQGALLDFGAISSWAIVRVGNTLAWLSKDERGGGQVIIAKGYTPQAISTAAIDHFIQAEAATGEPGSRGNLVNAQAFAIQIDGHAFVWFYIPGAETTPVYDLTENQWHEESHWDSLACVDIPHVAWTHAYAFEQHFVGDRRAPAIYRMAPDLFTDEVVAA